MISSLSTEGKKKKKKYIQMGMLSVAWQRSLKATKRTYRAENLRSFLNGYPICEET